MVGIIVSRAVVEPLADYLSRKIWAPYGMESDASWLTGGGAEIGGCCLNVTLRDYGLLGMFLLGGDSAGGAAVAPAGSAGGATPRKSRSAQPPHGSPRGNTLPGMFSALVISASPH